MPLLMSENFTTTLGWTVTAIKWKKGVELSTYEVPEGLYQLNPLRVSIVFVRIGEELELQSMLIYVIFNLIYIEAQIYQRYKRKAFTVLGYATEISKICVANRISDARVTNLLERIKKSSSRSTRVTVVPT